MTPTQFHSTIMIPAEAWFVAVVPEVRMNDAARVGICAIAGQESGWQKRVQDDDGPAHSFWQFERNGGVAGLMSNRKTGPFVKRMAASLGIKYNPMSVWAAMATPNGDGMSFGMARLLLWSDPDPLPAPSDDDAWWGYYARNWRPGDPRPDAWPANIAAARGVILGASE